MEVTMPPDEAKYPVNNPGFDGCVGPKSRLTTADGPPVVSSARESAGEIPLIRNGVDEFIG
jgi:hypothetical protein